MSSAPKTPAMAAGTDFYLLDELISDEEREVRDRVRAFADTEVLPIAADHWERAEFPFEPCRRSPPSAWPAARSEATAARASPPSPPGS